jgi:hypothetical protein
MEISSYTSAFNLIKNEFDWEKALLNHLSISEETVVAVNTSEDDTLEVLKKFSEKSGGRIKIVTTDFSYSDPDLDGKVKNAALQATSHKYKLGLDLDEMVNPNQRDSWAGLVNFLDSYTEAQAFFVPVVDLYKNKHEYKSIGQKWYLHGGGLYRQTVNFAKNPDGTHDTDRSDSCELTDKNGDLVSAYNVLANGISDEEKLNQIASNDLPHVIHLGHLNLRKRVLRNRNFWRNHWKVQSGRDVYVPTSENEIKHESKKHNLDVSFL